jgi:hypothetical protein
MPQIVSNFLGHVHAETLHYYTFRQEYFSHHASGTSATDFDSTKLELKIIACFLVC